MNHVTAAQEISVHGFHVQVRENDILVDWRREGNGCAEITARNMPNVLVIGPGIKLDISRRQIAKGFRRVDNLLVLAQLFRVELGTIIVTKNREA